MNREEAWNRIDAIIAKHEIDDDYVTITSLLDYDALRLARKLLEQEHCEDCISRDALCKWINNKTFGDIVVASEHRFSELPSVQPKQTECEDCCNGNQEEKAKLCQKSYLAGMEHRMEQEPCEDCISKQAAIDLADELKDNLPDDEHLSDMVMSHNEGILEYQTQLSLLPSVHPECTEDYCPAAFKPVECDDCISRSSIKQKLQEHHDFFVNAYGGFSNLPQNDKSRVDEITNCIAMVVNEPSITPAEKVGHWIYDRTRDWDGEYKYECSECGMGSDVNYAYCMRCGCKMEEVEE